MMPVYMNSPQPQGHYCQGFGNYPHHATTDASSSVSCEHWPTPSPCYGCCIHGNFPAYNPYWPSCYPPQVPYHTCYANHSGFRPHAPPYYLHQPVPVCYQPKNDSEKDVSGKHHCTKCSPQMCYPENERGVVIEEHEPEIEKRNQGETLRSNNCSYPIMLIPHENTSNQEHGSSHWSGSHDQPPTEFKAPEDMKLLRRDPKSWSASFPFDERTMKSLVQNQDRKNIQNGKTLELPFDMSKLKSLMEGQTQKNKEEPGQLKCPIVWLPPHGKRQDVEARESRERNLKSFPSHVQVNEGQNAQQKGEVGNLWCKVPSDADEKSFMRSIPVKNHQQEPRNIPVNLSENNLPKPTEPIKRIAKHETVENTNKEQSSPKASRLPPICLRVDPLPKKRNNGSKTRSPRKEKEQPLTSEGTKAASPLCSKKAETKLHPEVCDIKCDEGNKEKKMYEGCLEEESAKNDSNLQKGPECEIVKPSETKENTVEPAKNTFTEEDAARIIQSTYRGYDVRRWEPTKKLKEIATVREQMGDVKRRIKTLQLSSDQHGEEKEIVVLGEMVMSLLLKLDSIQGLHPSIKDYRKSLARELSDIQEKLDSLKKSSVEDKAVKEQVEITSYSGHCPVNLEHTQLVEETKMDSDLDTEKVLPPSPEEHPMSIINTTDEQLVAEVEGTGLSETTTMDPAPAIETGVSDADLTPIPEKIVADETVPPKADGDRISVTENEDDNVMVVRLEEEEHKLPQAVQQNLGPENATNISEAEADTSEKEDSKRDDDTVLPQEEDVELSELLPIGVIDNETQVLPQDLSSCTREVADAEKASQDEANVDHSSDTSKDVGQETFELEEAPEREVLEHEISENQRLKEMIETLVKAGREQVEAVSNLTGRVKSLEKKLSQKKKTRVGRRKKAM